MPFLRGDEPKCGQPLFERDRRILEGGPDLERERCYGRLGVALPVTLAFQTGDVLEAASRATDHVIRPNASRARSDGSWRSPRKHEYDITQLPTYPVTNFLITTLPRASTCATTSCRRGRARPTTDPS